MCLILGNIVIPILLRLELHHESVRESALYQARAIPALALLIHLEVGEGGLQKWEKESGLSGSGGME